MATQNLKVRSGNRVVVVLDGKQVGLIQSYRASDDYGPDAASGIGDIHAVEHVPSMARHSISISAMMLMRGALLEAGIAMENGDAVLRGLVMDFEVYDKDNGSLLRKYVGCSYASGDIEISKHAILVQSAQFNALDVTGMAF